MQRQCLHIIVNIVVKAPVASLGDTHGNGNGKKGLLMSFGQHVSICVVHLLAVSFSGDAPRARPASAGQGDQAWLKELKLIIADKRDIESGRMLSTNHMEAVQKLIGVANPHLDGLQPPLRFQAAGFEYCPSEAVQIHHTGNSHFVASTTIGNPPEVSVFDSIFDAPNRTLRKQLMELYRRPEDKVLIVRWMPGQKQTGGRDCGLFASAVLCELTSAAGVDPLDVARMSFAQGAMRKHLLQLLESSKISVFPKADEPKPRVQPSVTWFALSDDGRKGPFSTKAEAQAADESDLQGAFSLSSRGRVSRPSSKKAAGLFSGSSPQLPPRDQQPKKDAERKSARRPGESVKETPAGRKKSSAKN